MSKVSGLVTKVSEQRTGANNRGPWSVQHLVFDGGQDVSVWNRPDLSILNGQRVSIDGVSNNQKGELQLKNGEGDIKVTEVSAVKPLTGETTSVGKHGNEYGPIVGKRTIDEYLNVVDYVIRHVSQSFRSHIGPEPQEAAVAAVVNGTMVSFVKGEFVVPSIATKSDIPL